MDKNDGYLDTVKKAKDADGDRTNAKRAEQLDAEMAYETLSVASSMGMYGTEESVAELMQLELAGQLMYKQNEENGFNDKP